MVDMPPIAAETAAITNDITDLTVAVDETVSNPPVVVAAQQAKAAAQAATRDTARVAGLLAAAAAMISQFVPFLHTIPATKIIRHGRGETRVCPSRDDGVAETVVLRFAIYLAINRV
jgi:hypothetical protein